MLSSWQRLVCCQQTLYSRVFHVIYLLNLASLLKSWQLSTRQVTKKVFPFYIYDTPCSLLLTVSSSGDDCFSRFQFTWRIGNCAWYKNNEYYYYYFHVLWTLTSILFTTRQAIYKTLIVICYDGNMLFETTTNKKQQVQVFLCMPAALVYCKHNIHKYCYVVQVKLLRLLNLIVWETETDMVSNNFSISEQ